MSGQILKRRDGLVGEEARKIYCYLCTRIETRLAYVVGGVGGWGERVGKCTRVDALLFNCLKSSETHDTMYGHICVFIVSKIFIGQSFH